ncbi:MAG: AAA family ATPase [Deltaproteobacteria bacterium]|nr:AAA family ATPase [Deltaproteobacteria bacterium]MBW2044266.1 AAA family ATPase [Deltaproteobacteria bacterium]MBW2300736.1 AAA family ATPase [Deltaproteobacteria bacterium]
MYLEYWGFSEFPFENVPDPRFFYLSKSHEEALTRLLYAAKMRKGGAMLSGEVGCGKTTLTKVCIQELPREKFDIGLVVNPRLEPVEFLQEVLYQFQSAEVPETKVKCLRMLREKMIENLKARKETVLMIDEAQLLTETTLEEIRLLLNFQMNDRFLITIILLGQPELQERIRAIPQLGQRIAIKYHLDPFDYADTSKYIAFRQKKAGRQGNAFSEESVEKIYENTQGVPRKINNLCDLSLLIGFSRNDKVIGPEIIESVVSDGALL